MKKILILLALLCSSPAAFAFSTWFQNPIYYCPDDATTSGSCIETDWGCSFDYTTPSHAYDATRCISAPAPIVCTPPAVRDNNVQSATYNTCLSPPIDYSCSSPKSWIYTAESSWKCVNISALSTCSAAPYAATKAGACSSGGGVYHATGFVKTLICDPANTYECKPPGSDCDFWTSIIDSTCTN